MPSSSFGKGIALQSDLSTADKLWVADEARQAAGIASQKKADDLERAKAAEFVNKYLNTEGTNLHPIYQPQLQKQSTEYITNLYAGLKRDPKYAQSVENIQAFKKLASDIDKWQQSTTNIGKTANMLAEHPDDIQIDPILKDALETGNYENFVKANGTDYYSPMQGVHGITNMVEANKAAQADIYKDFVQGAPVKRGGLITVDDIYNPDLEKHKQNALMYYQSHPFSASEWEKKGGFDAYYKALEVPTPFKKPRYMAQESKGFNVNYNGGGGGVVSNAMYNLYPIGQDSQHFRFSKSGANTETSDKEFVHPNFVDESGKPVVDPDTNKPYKNIKGNIETADIINGQKYVGIRVEIPEKKTGSFVTRPKESKVIYMPLDDAGIGQTWAATNDGKKGGILPFGLTFKGKVIKAQSTAQPKVAKVGETQKSGTPKKSNKDPLGLGI